MSELAPVILFVYHRLNHTKKTIQALQQNHIAKDTSLIIYSDAPSKKEHEKEVSEVRDYLHSIKGFKEVKLIFQAENKGLAKSIIDGVNEQINIYGKAIVLEDDLLTSPWFLKYMNAALLCYEKEERVMQIAGFSFPVSEKLPDTFFVKFTSSWGWATWKRAWNHLSVDTQSHIEKIEKRELVDQFNMDDGMGFFNHLLDNRDGKMNTWAVKWYATVFLQNGLCLYPSKTLVKNIGHDGSGENSLQNILFLKQELYQKEIVPRKIAIEEDSEARKSISSFLKIMNGEFTNAKALQNKIRDKIKYEFRKLFKK